MFISEQGIELNYDYEWALVEAMPLALHVWPVAVARDFILAYCAL